jgi:tetratricopeptide (TPR) repeat protein
LFAGPEARAEGPEAELKKGVYAYEHGDYAEAITALTAILSPLKLTSEDDIVSARKYLGAAYYFTQKKDEAADEFRKLIILKPDFKLDPFNFPPPLVLFFDGIKAGLSDRLEKPKPPEEKKDVVKETVRIIDRRIEKRSLYVNFIPFGAPQFQNGQRTKGWILFGMETALLGANVLSYWVARSYADERGYVAAESDRASANTWATIQMTSLAVFGGAVVYGIIDGLANFEPEVVAGAGQENGR